MKNKRNIAARTTFYLLIAATAALVVAACCLLGSYPVASYILFGCGGFTLLAQPIAALIITLCTKGKPNGFVQWATSLEVSAVVLLIAVLLPLLLVLRLVDVIRCASLAKKE